MKNYMIVPQDVDRSHFVFFDSRTDGATLKSCYLDLRCDQCGKIDELAALKRGLSSNIKFPKKMPDFFDSSEGIRIVSVKMRDFFETVAGGQIWYFSFPVDDRFFVAIPKKLVAVSRESKAFRTEGYCVKCGRVRESVIGSELYQFCADFVLGAFLFECPTNIAPLWIACEQIVEPLKKAKLKGVDIHPYFKLA